MDGMYGLVDPSSEVAIELDAHGDVTFAYPHASSLLAAPPCRRGALRSFVAQAFAARVMAQIDRARTSGAPVVEELRGADVRLRVMPRPGGGSAVLLRRLDDDNFWRLFEMAPVPLGFLFGTTSSGNDTTRFNRRFFEVFGYTAEEVPTATAWWPLAYPDAAYRESVRTEWFRRMELHKTEGVPVTPLEARAACKDRSVREIEFYATDLGDCRLVVFVDQTERNRAARELREAHDHVRALSELLPVCAWCKRMRDDGGYWQAVEQFLAQRTGAKVTHGICPDCREQHFRRASTAVDSDESTG
jgi:PAS domain-containing protein